VDPGRSDGHLARKHPDDARQLLIAQEENFLCCLRRSSSRGCKNIQAVRNSAQNAAAVVIAAVPRGIAQKKQYLRKQYLIAQEENFLCCLRRSSSRGCKNIQAVRNSAQNAAAVVIAAVPRGIAQKKQYLREPVLAGEHGAQRVGSPGQVEQVAVEDAKSDVRGAALNGPFGLSRIVGMR
jgi:hypothetical protein